MSNSSMTWKFLFPCCVNPDKSKSKSKLESKKIVPTCLQRLLISDISNPDWEFSIQELSTSLIGSNLHVFTLDELRVITSNFSYTSNFIGEGGFGAVYKGFIDGNFRPGLKSQSVAVKILDLEGPQGHKEWLTEVIFLGQMRHKHLVKLIGYCCENEQRVLVYEYMARGNLDNQLFRRSSAALPWLTRMKIALGAAKGLAFLHEADRSVIFRDFKAANILLDHDFNAKLSDFGFARDGPEDDESHITTEHILGTQGYVAPEYAMTGHLTIMSDVYSFGVVLLELLTGRRSMDKNRPKRAHSLAEWARPFLKDHRKLDMIIDPRFEGHYSTQGVKIAAMLAHQCLSHHPKSRPNMTTVVRTLEPLLNMDDISTHFVYVVPKADKKDHFVNSTEENKKNGDRLRHNALHMKLNNGRDSSRFHR